MSTLADQAAGAATTIGRYFSVVSAIPSTLFVAYVYLLVRTGAWSGPVTFSKAVGDAGLKDLAVLGVGSLAAAIAVHPLQFTLIRLLEGYWGVSELGRSLAVVRIRHHRNRRLMLEAMVETVQAPLRRAEEAGEGLAAPTATTDTIAAAVAGSEAARELLGYPALPETLPTRLGNMLRRHEMLAGAPYGLDAITAIPRIGVLAPGVEADYVQDQRVQMELAVRTAFLGAAASLVTLAFMWWHAWWVLLALAPYTVAYLAYRGAVVVAGSYGIALAVLIELNRFTLYERLRLPPVNDTAAERGQNAALVRALALNWGGSLNYQHATPVPHEET